MKSKMNDYNWDEIQKLINENHTQKQIRQLFHISRKVWERAKKFSKIMCKKCYHKQSEKTKKLLSEKMKNYLKNNQGKHVWKKNSKFISTPCQMFKNFLSNNGVSFYPEYTDSKWQHNYSIDIAFVNEKVGVEINGNQHYNSDGTLKQYYRIRQDYLKSCGWKIIEIPYSMVWNDDFKEKILNDIKTKFAVVTDYDYAPMIALKQRKNAIKYVCSRCGGIKKTKGSVYCNKCASIISGQKNRKVERPDKETLKHEIAENSFLALGRKYGVSDNAIRKWCKGYGMA